MTWAVSFKEVGFAVCSRWESAGISFADSRSAWSSGTAPPSAPGHAGGGSLLRCCVARRAGYRPIVHWVHSQEVSVWHRLGFYAKPPQRTAFQDLLKAISPEHFEAGLRRWATAVLGKPLPNELQAVAIDTKTLCGSLQPHLAAIQLLAALTMRPAACSANRRSIRRPTKSRPSPQLLEHPRLKGAVITGDAIFCQREICEQITQAGGHYFFVVKDNQPTLKAAIQDEFQEGFSPLQRAAAASKQLCAAYDRR